MAHSWRKNKCLSQRKNKTVLHRSRPCGRLRAKRCSDPLPFFSRQVKPSHLTISYTPLDRRNFCKKISAMPFELLDVMVLAQLYFQWIRKLDSRCYPRQVIIVQLLDRPCELLHATRVASDNDAFDIVQFLTLLHCRRLVHGWFRFARRAGLSGGLDIVVWRLGRFAVVWCKRGC